MLCARCQILKALENAAHPDKSMRPTCQPKLGQLKYHVPCLSANLSLDICRHMPAGMKYPAESKYVHHDLAMHNCLVTSRGQTASPLRSVTLACAVISTVATIPYQWPFHYARPLDGTRGGVLRQVFDSQ